MLKLIVDAIVVMAIIVVLFSPAVIFSAIDRYLLREHNDAVFGRNIFNETLEIDTSYGGEIFNRPDTIERDGKIIENLTRMSNEGSPEVRAIWNLKKTEFERKLHWLATMTCAKGHETLPVV